jgi:Ca-activated chloride channel family protein
MPIRPWLAALTLACAGFAAASAQQPTFRSGARTVAVYATVTQKDGGLVTDLTQDEFTVKDRGKERPITVFTTEAQPIRVVLMIDRSGSMRGNFGLVEQAAEQFVTRLGPEDRARVGIFADRIEIQPADFTNDRTALMRVLRAELPVTGPSPLWNAIDQSMTALEDQDGRKVVLVFSDGMDAPMNFRFDNRSILDVMRRAQERDVMVYTIGLQTTSLGGGGFGALTSSRPDPSLAAIADDTGGGYFELTRADNLAATFARIAEELHHQYAIGFEPLVLDDKMHKLELKTTRKGLKVRARSEYFAQRAPDETR